MLELRPRCEQCNKALPPDSTEAMICSFECTFCRKCVEGILSNVCPNCGGGFTPRPIRPNNDLKNGNFLGRYPATTKVVFSPVDEKEHAQFASAIRHIAAEKR